MRATAVLALVVMSGCAQVPSKMGTGEESMTQQVRRPIDSSLFLEGGQDVRQLRLAETVNAPVDKVFQVFADESTFQEVYAQESAAKANIDLAIGGAYEWLFDGETGSNGCQVLSFVPNEMLSFSWNAPPNQPEARSKRTWVVVNFEAVNPTQTRVSITHLGFGAEGEWNTTFEYFQNAWAFVLNRIKTAFDSP